MWTRRWIAAASLALLAALAVLPLGLRLRASEAWTRIDPGQSFWYEMPYHSPNEEVIVRVNYQAKPLGNGLHVDIYTPFRYAQWVKGEPIEPIGRGTPNKIDGTDLLWAGRFVDPATYYIHVSNITQEPLYYEIELTGKGAGPLALMGAEQPKPAAPTQPAASSATATATAAAPLPTATSLATATAGATMTATAAAPTATVVAPTATVVQPTATVVAPTATAAASAPAPKGTILFTSNRESWDDCYAMNADGSNVRRLTTFGFCYDAHFSPDGTKIVFTHQENADALPDIWVMNADGSNARNLTNSTDNLEEFPVFSPDGSKIAYLFGWPGGFEIYVMNADGSDRKPLTARQFDLTPAWSPDGSKIAFTRLKPGGVEIFTVPAGGGEPTQIISSSGRVNVSPVWSPDGKQIAFSAIQSGGQWQIYIMNADGSNQRVVVPGVGSDRGNSTNIAAWKNGRLLVGGYRGNWDVFFGDPTTGQLTAVTDHPKDDKPTDWRP